MYELEIQMNDSINIESNIKASIKKQFQYEYEKKAAADSVRNGEEKKVKNALLTAQEAQLKQEKTKSYALYGGLLLVLMFAGFMVNRFRVTHKQKQIIELKEIETQKQRTISFSKMAQWICLLSFFLVFETPADNLAQVKIWQGFLTEYFFF